MPNEPNELEKRVAAKLRYMERGRTIKKLRARIQELEHELEQRPQYPITLR